MSRGATVHEVDTPLGPARVTTFQAEYEAALPTRPLALVLGHGAGGGIGAKDLVTLAAALPSRGITVALVEQPWRVAGRRVAGPPAQLDRAWTAVLGSPAIAETSLRAAGLAGRLVVGGRSAGARVACRTALEVGAVAVVALAFPLHPPGRPERSRADELLGAGVPTLVVQGERDAFGGPDQLPAGPHVAAIPYADHSFTIPKAASLSQRAALDLLVESVAAFLAGLS